MQAWYKVCQIGICEQQVHLQHLLHLNVRVDVWLFYCCVQFAEPADWEAPGVSFDIGELIQNWSDFSFGFIEVGELKVD